MSFADDTRGFDHLTLTVNDVALHVVVGGKGPLVVLLHGWPESWVTWRYVMGPLKDAGFTVAVPDLRGFGDSEKPRDVEAYRLEHVAGDIKALIKALGFEKAHVIGHDWGGATAWYLAHNFDDVLDKLVIMNAPEPSLFRKRLKKPAQLRASYYMFLFQVPGVAESLVSAGDFRPIRNIFKYQPKRTGAYDDEDVRLGIAAMKKPGALEAGMKYYRAGFRESLRGAAPPKKRVIDRPTLVLWGLDDRNLPADNLDGLERVVKDLRVVKIPQCCHFVQHDAPDLVVKEALAHFRQ